MSITLGSYKGKKMSLSESMQKMKVRFTFVKKTLAPNGIGSDSVAVDLERLHPAALCRDYLNDMIVEDARGKGTMPSPIYGMHFRGIKLDGDCIRLIVEGKEGDISRLSQNFPLLNDFEGIHATAIPKKSVLTTITSTQVMIEADNSWRTSTLYFSFFTYLLRALCYEVPDDAEGLEDHLSGLSMGANEGRFFS